MSCNSMPLRIQKYINKNNNNHDTSYIPAEIFPYAKLKIRGNPLLLISRTIIYGVYFICCIGNYKTIVAEQLATIQRSGLFLKTKMIFCFICQYTDEILPILEPYLSKIKIISTTENLYEKFAIENFRAHIQESNQYYLFYFHTKGVSRDPDKKKVYHEIRKNLDYFILEKHDICIFWLDHNYDAVGTSLSLFPLLHFSGNFWWTKSSHLAKLPSKLQHDGYLAPEMYICSKPNGKYISVCQSTNNGNIKDFLKLTNQYILQESTCSAIQNVIAKKFMQYYSSKTNKIELKDLKNKK